jgi:hypothetical protein
MRKTWQEKLKDRISFPKVLRLEKDFTCYKAVHKMGAEVGDEIVLVNPSEVVTIMKQVPKGRLITIVEVCMSTCIRDTTPRGFEPLISTVTGWHVKPLHHGAS